MQKTAKNISLSIAGMMVAVPAGADIASIDYVQRWVQNQSPIPAGSVITGYASGSYGSYLLAGSTVGGPYSGVSIEGVLDDLPITSGLVGGKVLGIGDDGNLGWIWGSKVGIDTYFGGATGTPKGVLVSTGLGIEKADGWLSLSDLATGMFTGSAFHTGIGNSRFIALNSFGELGVVYGSLVGKDTAWFAATGKPGAVLVAPSVGINAADGWLSLSDLATGMFSTAITGGQLNVQIPTLYGSDVGYVSGSLFGSYIGGYNTRTGSIGYLMAAGDSTLGEPARWQTISEVGSYLSPYIKGSQITGYGSSTGGTPYVMMGSSMVGAPTYQSMYDFIKNSMAPYSYIFAMPGFSGGFVNTYIQSYGSYIGGYQSGSGAMTKILGFTGTGSNIGSETAKWFDVSGLGSYIKGSQISGYGTTNSAIYVLGAGNASGSASWVKVSGGGLSNELFIGAGATSGTPNYILGSPNGGTGSVPGYYDISKMGTVIGTVNGSQVKIEQTATAETLQANTGTIYFPVVQNGTVYGVTLNDFYILMNAQF